MKLISCGILLCFGVLLFTCNKVSEEMTPYSFFVAGHAYGKAAVNNDGVHPPFKKDFDRINSVEDLSFGVLNGDFVYTASEQDWQEVQRDIDSFDFPIHYVMGNHEYLKPEVLQQNIQQTYYSFEVQNDLHIVLDGNPDGWNIEGEQYYYLKNTLNEKAELASRIFIYVHQLIWWSPDGPYSEIQPNSDFGRDTDSNFKTEIKPVLEQTNKTVYVIAGDVGAANWSDNCSYHIDGNIHLISSGMGKDLGSNYLIIHVRDADSIKIELVAIYPDQASTLKSFQDFCITD